MNSIDLSVELAPRNRRGLLLANPVMTASGTFGYGVEYGSPDLVSQLGAVICKGTTLRPRDGNPQPRLVEMTCGLLNSVGLQNIGVEAVIREKAPLWAKLAVPFLVNIAGETVAEYGEVASKLEGVPGVKGIEVNISCPNVKAGGIEFGTDPHLAAEVTAAVRSRTSLPVMVKLSPNVTDIVPIARAVADAGADSISLINTLRGMAISLKSRKPVLANISGGLSGPGIKPVALYFVYKAAGAVRIPVIGCGGITTGPDAVEFLLAGASAVQIGTALLSNPEAALEVVRGITAYMESERLEKVADLIGAAR